MPGCNWVLEDQLGDSLGSVVYSSEDVRFQSVFRGLENVGWSERVLAERGSTRGVLYIECEEFVGWEHLGQSRIG